MAMKEIKMKSNAPSPQKIDGIGIVHPGETFPAPENLAKKLEKSFFERVKEEKPALEEQSEPETKPKEKEEKTKSKGGKK